MYFDLSQHTGHAANRILQKKMQIYVSAVSSVSAFRDNLANPSHESHELCRNSGPGMPTTP
jgi:hypothetical protein